MEKVGIGDINHIVAVSTYLWALGRIYDSSASDYKAAFYRWDLPEKTKFPAFDDTPAINTSGSVIMAKWDGGLPDQDKAFIKLDVYLKDSVMDTEHTVVVKFKIEDGSQVTLGTINATSGDNHQVLYFNTITNPESKAIGTDIELTFELATDDTVSPEVYAYTLHATYQPEDIDVWEFYVRVGNHLGHRKNGRSEDTMATMISNLETLLATTWPIELAEDLDESGIDGTGTSHRGLMEKGSLARAAGSEYEPHVEVWVFRFIEVKLAA